MSYEKNDPKGWGGDPSRGAALGRRDITPAPPVGTVTVQEICLDRDGYDPLGTYWGVDRKLFSVRGETAEGEEWEMTTRSRDYALLRCRLIGLFDVKVKRVAAFRRTTQKESQ